jgi:glycosyltransferase involved in cell wall biosynthesis
VVCGGAQRRGAGRREHRPRGRDPLTADVVIDARAAARPELGGVERWARELSARLPALDPGRYTVAAPPAAFSHRLGHLWEQVVLPVQARRARVLLCPANLAPLAHPRTAVVIHDAAPLRNPSWYSDTYVRVQRALLPRIARRAKLVITVSEFSRGELRELLDVDAHVVPGGVDERFTPDADPEPARRAHALDRPYVLTVASRTTRKNLEVLGPVADALAADGVEIVAAGGDRPQFRAGGGEGHHAVRALGHVDDDLLAGLYAGAQAFVLPSLYEGFGLTCLEAMACGTPVVAANRAALPETCGDAALLVAPTDPAAITSALRTAIGNQMLRAAGPPHAAAFTWDATARAVDALVRSLG